MGTSMSKTGRSERATAVPFSGPDAQGEPSVSARLAAELKVEPEIDFFEARGGMSLLAKPGPRVATPVRCWVSRVQPGARGGWEDFELEDKSAVKSAPSTLRLGAMPEVDFFEARGGMALQGNIALSETSNSRVSYPSTGRSKWEDLEEKAVDFFEARGGLANQCKSDLTSNPGNCHVAYAHAGSRGMWEDFQETQMDSFEARGGMALQGNIALSETSNSRVSYPSTGRSKWEDLEEKEVDFFEARGGMAAFAKPGGRVRNLHCLSSMVAYVSGGSRVFWEDFDEVFPSEEDCDEVGELTPKCSSPKAHHPALKLFGPFDRNVSEASTSFPMDEVMSRHTSAF